MTDVLDQPRSPRARDLSLFLRSEPAGLQAMDFAVDGIRCAGCMSAIERGLTGLAGLRSVRVNLTAKRVTVNWEAGEADPDGVMGRLGELGFDAHPFSAEKVESAEAKEERRLLRCLGVAAFAAMNIMLLSVSVWSGHATGLPPEMRDFFHWVSALIAIPAAAYAGRPFFESAIRALKARAVNMDVPITLGIVLALGMSVFETMNHGEHAYFDGAIMLIFFLLIGRVLDQMMRRRTRDVATNLAALRAETAVKFISPQETREVPVAAIDPGDLVLVRPGERIAVDGVVEKGRSDVDQSLVTGETAHVALKAGDPAYAGTLNISGALQIRVRNAASGTLLDQVEELLRKATGQRSSHVHLADRVARLYAPVVHVTALATFLGWMLFGLGWQPALVIAITVLIITCPCALALAIPAVQVVSAGALFRRSVLLNSGDALERLAKIDTVVFDKTGTLTEPQASVINLSDCPPELAALAGRLALSSRHPLAAALARASAERAPFADAREEPGRGLSVTIDGRTLKLGAADWCNAEAAAMATARRHPGASLIAVSLDGASFAFALEQALRPDAVEVVAHLRSLGFAVEIVSGDRAEPVARAAEALGVESFTYAAKPADKIARLEALASQGRKVLMVGDGINDAPALAAAHVSMSPINAAHITQAQADALFTGSALAPVRDAVLLSRRARAIMIENLWLAVIYNAIAVPVAMAGFATPLVAAAAMSGSSVLVTLNALRARHLPGRKAS